VSTQVLEGNGSVGSLKKVYGHTLQCYCYETLMGHPYIPSEGHHFIKL
jgi:hypothetical protein